MNDKKEDVPDLFERLKVVEKAMRKGLEEAFAIDSEKTIVNSSTKDAPNFPFIAHAVKEHAGVSDGSYKGMASKIKKTGDIKSESSSLKADLSAIISALPIKPLSIEEIEDKKIELEATENGFTIGDSFLYETIFGDKRIGTIVGVADKTPIVWLDDMKTADSIISKASSKKNENRIRSDYRAFIDKNFYQSLPLNQMTMLNKEEAFSFRSGTVKEKELTIREKVLQASDIAMDDHVYFQYGNSYLFGKIEQRLPFSELSVYVKVKSIVSSPIDGIKPSIDEVYSIPIATLIPYKKEAELWKEVASKWIRKLSCVRFKGDDTRKYKVVGINKNEGKTALVLTDERGIILNSASPDELIVMSLSDETEFDKNKKLLPYGVKIGETAIVNVNEDKFDSFIVKDFDQKEMTALCESRSLSNPTTYVFDIEKVFSLNQATKGTIQAEKAGFKIGDYATGLFDKSPYKIVVFCESKEVDKVLVGLYNEDNKTISYHFLDDLRLANDNKKLQDRLKTEGVSIHDIVIVQEGKEFLRYEILSARIDSSDITSYELYRADTKTKIHSASRLKFDTAEQVQNGTLDVQRQGLRIGSLVRFKKTTVSGFAKANNRTFRILSAVRYAHETFVICDIEGEEGTYSFDLDSICGYLSKEAAFPTADIVLPVGKLSGFLWKKIPSNHETAWDISPYSAPITAAEDPSTEEFWAGWMEWDEPDDPVSTTKKVAYRIAATQVSRLTKQALIRLVQLKSDNETMKAFGTLLDTQIGEAMISGMIGYAISKLPKEHKLKQLSKEFQISGMALAGNAAFDAIMAEVLPGLMSAWEAIPEEKIRLSKENKTEISSSEKTEEKIEENTNDTFDIKLNA